MDLLIDPYNEAKVNCDGNVEGGSGKKLMIQKPLRITFHPFVLHKLIDKLHILFQKRFRELIGNTQIFPLSNESLLQTYAAIKAEHHKCYEAMKAHGVFEYVF